MRSRAKKGTRLCRSLSSYAREARRRPNRRQSSSYVLRSPGHRIRTRSGRRPLECARSSCSVLGSSSPESHALGERLRGFWMCGMRLWCRWRFAGIALLSRRLRYGNIPCMAVRVLAADAFMQYGRTPQRHLSEAWHTVACISSSTSVHTLPCIGAVQLQLHRIRPSLLENP